MAKLNIDYIAGFFDGEGCISANIRGIRVIFTNTNLPILQNIDSFFGLKSKMPSTKSRTVKDRARKECYYLTYWNRQAEQVLRKLQPFLLIKRKECDLALEFQTTVASPGNKKGFGIGVKRLTQDQLDLRKELVLKIKELKHI